MNLYTQIDFPIIMEKVCSYALSDEAKALLMERKPSSDLATVNKRLDETAEAVQCLHLNTQVPFLAMDTIGLLMRKVEQGFILQPSELVACADFLRGIGQMKHYFERYKDYAPILYRYASHLLEEKRLSETIYQAVSLTQVLSSADRHLQKCRQEQGEKQKKIQHYLDKYLKNFTHKEYVQEFMIVEKNGRPTIPFKSSYKHKIDGTIVEESSKGLTTYIEPSGVSKLVMEKQALDMEEQDLVTKILCDLTNAIAEHQTIYTKNTEVMTELDVIFARAKCSKYYGGVRVEVNKDNIIQFDEVTHPLIQNAKPLSLNLGQDKNALVITGINAGGKTVVLKTLGLLTLMTMNGLLIPSGKRTNIAIMDNIFISIGDNQSLNHSLSTFSSEMKQMSVILQQATKHSLVLLDELGSGTDPKEATSLANAILHQLYQKKLIIVATTHFNDIKEYALSNPYFEIASVGFDEETLQPTYQLLLGSVSDSKAFYIAEKMGLPEDVMCLATTVFQKGIPIHFPAITLQPTPKLAKQNYVEFSRGDVVYLHTIKKEGLFYSYEQGDLARVFYDKEWLTLPLKRLSLVRLAKNLYPKDYNLDLLFIEDYQAYKLQRDLLRGSKKAWKKQKHRDKI